MLQKNITKLGLEVDNFPLGAHEDPDGVMNMFPDEIVRKDILDELRAPDPELALAAQGEAPLPPPCAECIAPYLAANRYKKNLAYRCRVVLGHTNPSYKFTASERNEFLAVVELLEERKRHLGQQSNAAKRNYKRWSPDEKHTILIVSVLYGLKHQSKVSEFLTNRNENQIRSFINKKLDPIELTAISTGMKPLPPPPKGYIPPKKILEELKRRSDAGEDVSHIQNSFSNLNNIKMPPIDSLSKADGSLYSASSQLERENTAASIYAGDTVSQVAASSGGRWSRMLSIAGGDYHEENVVSESDESGKEEEEEGKDDNSVGIVEKNSKKRVKHIKPSIEEEDAGMGNSNENSLMEIAMKPIPSQGRLQDKYGGIAPMDAEQQQQQQNQEQTDPRATPTAVSVTGDASSSTGLAAEATVKILSDTIKILASKVESVTTTQGVSVNESNQSVKGEENTKKKASGAKQPSNKGTKLTKSGGKKAIKDKLKIETGGRRGKAKFDKFFEHHETEHSIYNRGSGSELLCEDSNSGLIDPSLPLTDDVDILQSPTKLVSAVNSEISHMMSSNPNVEGNISTIESTASKKNEKKSSLETGTTIQANTQQIGLSIPIDSPPLKSPLGISSDITAEFSSFALPHVTSENPMHMMGEQTMDSFSLLPHGSEEFSMLQ